MQERSFSTADLVLVTYPVLGRLLLVWGAIALVKAALYFVFGFSGAHAVVGALFFGALFFSAPLAVSALRTRRRTKLFSRAGRKTLTFCFVWGAATVAMFIATLQLTQGMAATALNYALAMLVGGLFCSTMATIPNGR